MKRKIGTDAGISLLISIAAVMLLSVAGAMLLALMIVSENLGMESSGAGVFIIRAVAVMIGSLLVAHGSKEKALVRIVIVCGSYFALLLTFSLAFGQGVAGMPACLGSVLAGGGIASILLFAGNRSGGHKRKFKQFR